MSELDCETALGYAHDARRGRLSDASSEQLAKHLASCTDCRNRHRVETALDAALAKMPRMTASLALTHRLSAITSLPKPSHAKPAARSRFSRWIAAAAVLAAAAVVFIVLVARRDSSQVEALAGEVVSDHLRLLYADKGLEVQSGGIHQVKPWFSGRLDFAPVLAYEGDDDFQLVGGSVAVFRERRAAAFAFKHNLHRVTLLVFRADSGSPAPTGGADAQTPAFTRLQRRGFNIVLWQRAELGYALVSDMSSKNMDLLATRIAAAK
jgi:anti-sigma factor RsiW